MNRLLHRLTALLLATMMAFGSVFAALAEVETVQEYSDELSMNDIMLLADASNKLNETIFYIGIDGEWVEAGRANAIYDGSNGNSSKIEGRFYVLRETVEGIYRQYTDDVRWGEFRNYYKHDGGDDTIHSDNEAKTHVAGSCTCNVTEDLLGLRGTTYAGSPFHVYYCPAEPSDRTHKVDAISTNTFYSIKLNDAENLTGFGDGRMINCAFMDTSATISVDDLISTDVQMDEIEWTCIGQDGTSVGMTEQDGKKLFVIEDISQPYTITAKPTSFYNVTFQTAEGEREMRIPKDAGTVQQWLQEKAAMDLSINGQQTLVGAYSWTVGGAPVASDRAFAEDMVLVGSKAEYKVTLKTADGGEQTHTLEGGTNLQDWLNTISIFAIGEATVDAYDWTIELADGSTVGVGPEQYVLSDLVLVGAQKNVYTVTFLPGVDGSFTTDEGHEFQVYSGGRLSEANIRQQRMQLIPPEGQSFIGWYYWVGVPENEPDTVSEDRTGWMPFSAQRMIGRDTKVHAVYDNSCTITYYTDASMTEVMATKSIAFNSTLNLSPQSLPTDGEFAAAQLPPDNKVFSHWVNGTNGVHAAFSGNEPVTADISLYPVFRDYRYIFQSQTGTTLLTASEGERITYPADEVEDGKYFAGLTLLDDQGNEVTLAYDQLALPETFANLGVSMPELVDGDYVFTNVEVQMRDTHTLVYHPGANGKLADADDDGLQRVAVEHEVELLGGLDISLTANSSGMALTGWTTDPDGETAEFAPAEVLTDDQIEQHSAWDPDTKTLDLYPVWEANNAYKITFQFQYPPDAEFAGDIKLEDVVDKYIVYIPKPADGSGVHPTMPDYLKAGVLQPNNTYTDDGKTVLDENGQPDNRYEMVGWSINKEGDDSSATGGVYEQNTQYQVAVTEDTIFHLRWVDKSSNKKQEGTVYFFIRSDGKLPVEPGGFAASDYFPDNVDATLDSYGFKATAADVLRELTNIVNDPSKVAANMKTSGPSKTEIWAAIEAYKSGKSKTTYDRLMALATTDAPVGSEAWYAKWRIEWYAIKKESAWHIDGRLITEDSVKLTYNANGGYNAPPGETADKVEGGGATFEVKFSYANGNTTYRPTRDNFTFLGWSTDQNATVAEYTATGENEITISEDTTLYAVWAPSAIMIPAAGPFRGVKYEVNNGGAPGAPADPSLYTLNLELVDYYGDNAKFVDVGWKKTAAPEADGSFQFGQYNVAVAGVYTFRVWESINTAYPEIQYDPTEYELALNVEATEYGLQVKSYTFFKDNVQIDATTGSESFEQYNPVFEFTNRTGTRSITATKVWDDADNIDGVRHNAVTVQLLRDDAVHKTAVLNAANNWTYTWDGLDAVNNQTVAYIYTVQEILPADSLYTMSSMTGDMNTGYTITNTYVPETVTLSIAKYWDDNQDHAKDRPESITVTILGYDQANRLQVEEEHTITRSDNAASTDDVWYYVVSDLPRYRGGSELSYTLVEAPIEDYTGRLEALGGSADGYKPFKITNTIGTTSVSISKQVTGNMGDRNRAFDFRLVLTNADGTEVTGLQGVEGQYTIEGNNVIFDLKDGESVTLTGIPLNAQLDLYEDNSGYTTTYTVTGLADQTGASATYTVPDSEEPLSITVTNHKEVTVDTGLTLDDVPYVLLMATAIAGLTMMLLRKRRSA